MFDDGFDTSGKEADGDMVGDATTALAEVTALDKEAREWSEGGSAAGSRPGSASHLRPTSPSGGKSPVKGKSGSPSKGKGKGKPSKGGTPARYERSPRSRARSFSNLTYPEPAVRGRWMPSKLLGNRQTNI